MKEQNQLIKIKINSNIQKYLEQKSNQKIKKAQQKIMLRKQIYTQIKIKQKSNTFLSPKSTKQQHQSLFQKNTQNILQPNLIQKLNIQTSYYHINQPHHQSHIIPNNSSNHLIKQNKSINIQSNYQKYPSKNQLTAQQYSSINIIQLQNQSQKIKNILVNNPTKIQSVTKSQIQISNQYNNSSSFTNLNYLNLPDSSIIKKKLNYQQEKNQIQQNQDSLIIKQNPSDTSNSRLSVKTAQNSQQLSITSLIKNLNQQSQSIQSKNIKQETNTQHQIRKPVTFNILVNDKTVIQQPDSPPKLYQAFIKNSQDDYEYIEMLKKHKINQIEKKRKKRIQDKQKTIQNNLKQKQHMKKSEILSKSKCENIEAQNSKIKPTATQKQINKSPSVQILQYSQIFHSKNQTKQNFKQEDNISQISSNILKIQIPTKKRIVSLVQTPKSYTNRNLKFTNFQKTASQSGGDRLSGTKSQFFKSINIEKNNEYGKQTKNKKIMMNAITFVCLPGQLNRKQRQKLLGVMQNDSADCFIFLFKEYSRQVIKGIYSYDPVQNKLRKIYGDRAPAQVEAINVKQFYRFDSGARQFKIIQSCKTFSSGVHAIYMK